VNADGTLMSWSPESIEGMTEARWEKAKKRKVAAVLELNLGATSWADCYEVLLGASQHRDDPDLVRGLVDQLGDRSMRALDATSQLVIWERIRTGEILFEGKGFQVDDDLFQVAGRANWVLRVLHKKNFGSIKPSSGTEEVKAIADRWRAYLAGQTVDEWESPFETNQEGLSEIRSLAALEALVTSLQPSAAKSKHVQRCLKDLYGVTDLPTEPGAPGRLCSPDPWIHTYLAKITDVDGGHTSEWWADWWKQHKDQLEWNATDGKFTVRQP
jgi:hypothetical protein